MAEGGQGDQCRKDETIGGNGDKLTRYVSVGAYNLSSYLGSSFLVGIKGCLSFSGGGQSRFDQWLETR